MAKLLTGKEAAASLTAELRERAAALDRRGVTPRLVILRCGADEADGAYLRGALKRGTLCGVDVEVRALPGNVPPQALLAAIDAVNGDASVHGCLLLRPLPSHLREAEAAICSRLLPEKDVDGMTDASAAAVYLGRAEGFAPCTAEAVTVLLDHYGIDCAGKRAVVIGRSPVVGRPAAMLLLARNATVTVCHTRTADLPAVTREAIINMVLGIEGHTIVGDADESAASVVDAITPVPGGVGAVTSTVLMAHVIRAAERAAEGGCL